MFEVTVSGWFSASHQLRLGGVLEPLHGHNWMVKITCSGPRLDAQGLLLDFTVLRPALGEVLRQLHDRHLNELPAFANTNPSCENVCVHIAGELRDRMKNLGGRLTCVEVEEEPGCTARYFVPADEP